MKGKKKKQQINNFLVAFTVEKGYQTVEIMKYLLKQQEVAQVCHTHHERNALYRYLLTFCDSSVLVHDFVLALVFT